MGIPDECCQNVLVGILAEPLHPVWVEKKAGHCVAIGDEVLGIIEENASPVNDLVLNAPHS